MQIVRNGRAVAELRPIHDASNEAEAGRWHLADIDPTLKPQVSREDAMAPLDEEDWPSEGRS